MEREEAHRGLYWRSAGERRAARRAAAASAEGAVRRLRVQLDAALSDAAAARAALDAILSVDSGELGERLRLVAPVLAAGLAHVSVPKILTARRNLASHEFGVPADLIATSSQTELNRLQRHSAAGAGKAAESLAPSAAPPCPGGPPLPLRPCLGDGLRAEAQPFVPGAGTWMPLDPPCLLCTCGTTVFSSCPSVAVLHPGPVRVPGPARRVWPAGREGVLGQPSGASEDLTDAVGSSVAAFADAAEADEGVPLLDASLSLLDGSSFLQKPTLGEKAEDSDFMDSISAYTAMVEASTRVPERMGVQPFVRRRQRLDSRVWRPTNLPHDPGEGRLFV